MPSRRKFLIAGTGALAASVAGCGGGGATPASASPPPAGPAATPPSSPAPASAAADWRARSTATGVVVAYDFSAPPANGGSVIWGSLKASPKITCYQQNESEYGQYVVVDTTIVPPGSTASLRWDVPDCPTSGIAERGDLWWISIDNYADQFSGDTSNNEFWVQWRTRMDPTYATFLFEDRSTPPAYTAYKQLMMGEGMQAVNLGADLAWPAGYVGPGTSISQNQISYVRVDFEGETNMIGTVGTYVYGDTSNYGFKYPSSYHGKPGYVSLETNGADSSWYTDHNSGNEARHTAACQYQIGTGYTDTSTCFIYPSNEWFTLMVHVILGPRGHALSSLGFSYRNVPANYVSSTQVLLPLDTYVEHFDPSASAGMYVIVNGNLTGSVTAQVTVKALPAVVTFTGVVAGATSGTLTAPIANGTFNFQFYDLAIRTVTVTGGTSVTWSPALPADVPTTSGITAGGTTLYFTAGVDGETSGTLTTAPGDGIYGFTFNNPQQEERTITVVGTAATWTGALHAFTTTTTAQPQQALLTLTGLSGTIYNEVLTVTELENGFTNSTIEYYGAYRGGAMQLLHRRTGVVMRVGNYVNDSTGYTPTANYGTFAWTTFMTNKSLTQTHPVAQVWVGQIIIKAGATAPVTPPY
jgi:hypothetical protein